MLVWNVTTNLILVNIMLQTCIQIFGHFLPKHGILYTLGYS